MPVKRSTLYARLRRGWTMRQAEGKDPPPVKPRGNRKTNPNSLRQRAMAAGVPISTVESRIARGMTLDEAVGFRRPSKALYWAACDLLEVVEDLLATLEGQVDSMDYDRERALSVIKRAKGEK